MINSLTRDIILTIITSKKNLTPAERFFLEGKKHEQTGKLFKKGRRLVSMKKAGKLITCLLLCLVMVMTSPVAA